MTLLCAEQPVSRAEMSDYCAVAAFRAQPGCLGWQIWRHSGIIKIGLAGVREQGMGKPSHRPALSFGVKVDLQSACRVRLV